jgi:hypothetical protein
LTGEKNASLCRQKTKERSTEPICKNNFKFMAAMKNIVVAFISVLVAFTSCLKEGNELGVEYKTVEFTINPTEAKTVSIHSNTDWSLEIQQVGAWLSFTPACGRNDGLLNLTAQVKVLRRSGNLFITGGKEIADAQ